MVFRGKPSTGCERCRQRKIRCDERPEGCVNCEEMRQECPGYRNQLDLMFRDESAKVQLKAVQAKTKAIARRNQGPIKPPAAISPQIPGDSMQVSRSRSWLRPQNDSSTPSLSSFSSLSPTIDEQAMTFFLSTYATGIDGDSAAASPYRADLSDYGFDHVVATCMKALGLAGVATVSHHPGLMMEAKKRYLAGIRLTNTTLASHREVKKDSTLLSVLLLSLFEAMTGHAGTRSVAAWRTHIDGAAMLLKLRGPEQFASFTGRRMYIQVTTNLMMNCMAKSTRVPDYIRELNAELAKHTFSTDPTWRFLEMLAMFVDFRSDLVRGNISKLQTIFEKAVDLDKQASSIFSAAESSDWNYQTEYIDVPSDNVFCGYYHIYTDFLSAVVWNSTRTIRIHINDIIRNTLLVGFSSSPPVFISHEHVGQFESSTQTLYQLQSDILASVPQHLGYTSNHKASSDTGITSSSSLGSLDRRFPWSNFQRRRHMSFRTPSHQISRLPLIRVSGGFSFCWSLHIAGAMGISTKPVQKYVIDTLRYMGLTMGTQQALILAEALELKIAQNASSTHINGIIPRYYPEGMKE
ncbi:hypothetical protein AOQ84DRAFT_310494 [Glonium stellatum]|uniref:Zn(2)-C6 fungal-type domain-containing protein n=1 Tax=Glonium stellatum TaxID=574774 RepID=A0A8E2FAW5_9PEZI|nr:hypothetical protein AOQ84DRAFT_310494 [Glonium stellatum]